MHYIAGQLFSTLYLKALATGHSEVPPSMAIRFVLPLNPDKE